MRKILLIILLLPILLTSQSIESEQSRYESIAYKFLNIKHSELELTKEDILEMSVSDFYTNVNNGWKQLYLNQTYQGIKVHNALFNLTITKEGTVKHFGNRFVQNLQDKIDSDVMVLSSKNALRVMENYFGFLSEAEKDSRLCSWKYYGSTQILFNQFELIKIIMGDISK